MQHANQNQAAPGGVNQVNGSDRSTTKTNAMYYNSSSYVKVRPFSKSGSAQLHARGTEPLTFEQIRNATPSVFAEQKHESRSDRYSYIPTSEILTKLQTEGFQPFAAFQGGSRDEEKKGFTKHLIRLRYMGEQPEAEADRTVSEIVLMNSHDGTSSYRMMAGQFRMVCSNGLIISDGLMQEVRVKHTGDVARDVIDGCISILESAPLAAESIREMKALELSPAEQSIFARAALVARYDEAALAPITPAQVLAPQRREDAANDLWRTLNRVQENVIRGGVSYIQRDDNGRKVARRQTRPINGIDQNTAVNRALWQLAEEMKAIRAA